MSWQLLDTGARSAIENMELDAELLEQLDPQGPAILHWYDWSAPSLTHGYFIRPQKHLIVEALTHHGIEMARRSTGGGVVFHLWDCAFSLLIPSGHPDFQPTSLASYAWVNNKVLEAIAPFLQASAELTPIDAIPSAPSCSHFCMARPTQYDVVLGERKVVGAAQRRTRRGILHQGTIALIPPDEAILQELLPAGNGVADAMLRTTLPLLGPRASQSERATARAELRERLYQRLS